MTFNISPHFLASVALNVELYLREQNTINKPYSISMPYLPVNEDHQWVLWLLSSQTTKCDFAVTNSMIISHRELKAAWISCTSWRNLAAWLGLQLFAPLERTENNCQGALERRPLTSLIIGSHLQSRNRITTHCSNRRPCIAVKLPSLQKRTLIPE